MDVLGDISDEHVRHAYTMLSCRLIRNGHPYFHPYNTSGIGRFRLARRGTKPQLSGLSRLQRIPGTITQIYEGTNQIQRVVIAKRLLG